MVHGYHIIMPCYGSWLPNDPRGSWSDYVGCWEVARFGKTTFNLDQRTLAHLTRDKLAKRELTRAALRYPPVVLTGRQAASIAAGFADQAARSGYRIWACAILPEHTHLVIARHRCKAEQMTNLLKGAATRRLIADGIHPLLEFAEAANHIPRMWAENQWIAFLDSEVGIENAIGYVEQNPVKEGKPAQRWSWVTPFSGLDAGWTTYLD